MGQIVATWSRDRAARRATGGICGAAWALALLAALAVMVAGCASASSTSAGPTATPTAQQRIATLARHAIGGESQHATVTAAFGSPGAGAGTPTSGTTLGAGGAGDTSAVTVTIALKGKVPAPQAIGATQERVKTICFQVQRALWTSTTPLAVVTVSVVGPIYDDYADLVSGSYGAAVLKAPSAARLDWANLSPDAAWDVYGIWLRPDYQPKVVGQYGG
ncbi:MAG TPA: hypothetical protein VF116_01630 [Ktedonobacterales bacterium]